MAKHNQHILLNFANPSPGVLISLGALIVFVLFLVGLAIALATKYVGPPSQQYGTIFLLILLPVAGLVAATALILRNLQKLAVRSRDDVGELMLPESQRRKLNAEVREIARILEFDEEQLGDLRAAYVLAEDLALRQIEQEKKLPLKRHVKIGAAEFDAVFISDDVSLFVDVTFLITPNISQEKINAVLDKVETVKNDFVQIRSSSKIKLLLALVTQLEAADEAHLRASLATKFRSMSIDMVEIRLFDFEALQKIFTED